MIEITKTKTKLLLTGSSGFLGKNITPLLIGQGYTVSSIDIAGATYNCDLSNTVPKLNESFDIILHAAGKAHLVPRNEVENKLFFDLNYQGTVNLCRALENSKLPKSFIFISTVAVYGLETGENITEAQPLMGTTPYALSKIQAEQFLAEWCKKNNVILSIIRPSLIAGPNAPGNLGAMVKSLKTGYYLSIAGGKSRKSILMIQDVANLVPLLSEKGGIYNVCDDTHPSFKELEDLISKQLGKKSPPSIPYMVIKYIARFGDILGSKSPINTVKLKKITESLTFSNEKAKQKLGWHPLSVLDNYQI